MAASINGMAERLRELLAGSDFIELVGCHDVLSGMMAETAGFNAVFLSGYSAAASAFGNPDIGLTTLSETASMARSMIQRVRVPVVVDVDNGYGNEDNVIRTVREMESAGVAGIVMEDQILPKRCGHTPNKKVLPLDVYLRKLDFALRCRHTSMVIVARTDVSPIDEAVRRARAFHAAGADVTLIDGVSSLEELHLIGREVPGIKQVNLIFGGKTPILSAPELHQLGFGIILYSTPTLFLVARAMREWLPRLRESHDLNSLAPASTSFAEFQSYIEELYLSRVRDGNGEGEPH